MFDRVQGTIKFNDSPSTSFMAYSNNPQLTKPLFDDASSVDLTSRLLTVTQKTITFKVAVASSYLKINAVDSHDVGLTSVASILYKTNINMHYDNATESINPSTLLLKYYSTKGSNPTTNQVYNQFSYVGSTPVQNWYMLYTGAYPSFINDDANIDIKSVVSNVTYKKVPTPGLKK